MGLRWRASALAPLQFLYTFPILWVVRQQSQGFSFRFKDLKTLRYHFTLASGNGWNNQIVFTRFFQVLCDKLCWTEFIKYAILLEWGLWIPFCSFLNVLLAFQVMYEIMKGWCLLKMLGNGTLYCKFTRRRCLFENPFFFLVRKDSGNIDSIHPILEEGIDLFASGAVCVGKMCRTDLVCLIGFRVRIERAPISTEQRKPSLSRNKSNPRRPALSGLRLLQSFLERIIRLTQPR